MSMVSLDSQEFYQVLQQLDQLHIEKTAFAQEIFRYLLNAAIHFDEVNARPYLQTEYVSAYAKSIAAPKSDISRASRYSSSSVVLEKNSSSSKGKCSSAFGRARAVKKTQRQNKAVGDREET